MARRAAAAAPKPDVNDYVVRVYRWGSAGAGPPPHVVGVVERVGAEGRQAFHNLDELWRILSARRARARPRRITDPRHRA
jgi:hypothetical protein